jgi:cytoskeletal protein CcmA (bactofilin family)
MSKRGRLTVVTSLISASLLSVAPRASAQDVLTAAKTVQVESDVKGDVAAAGGSVTIAGPVEGYVLGAGRSVRIDAPVGNDLWAAGETVDIHDNIGNNAMVAGRLVRLAPGAVVGGDLRIAADRAVIQGTVNGDVEARADRVIVAPGAIIRGALTVRSPHAPQVSPRAQVGHVRYKQMDDRWTARPWPLAWFLTVLALLILGSATTALVPTRTERVAAMLHARLGRSILVGVMAVGFIPIGIVALAITLVGLPLAAVLSAIYVLLLALSAVAVSYRVGEWLLDLAHGTSASQWARMALGALVVSLGVTVPFMGWAVAAAVVIAGAGALALEERDLRTQLRGTRLA